MARRTVFLVAFYAVVVSVSTIVAALAAEKGPPKNSPENPQEHIKKLQDRVADLEARVTALERQQAIVALPPTEPAARDPQTDGQPPKGWEPRMFNGMQYYIVPLGGGSK